MYSKLQLLWHHMHSELMQMAPHVAPHIQSTDANGTTSSTMYSQLMLMAPHVVPHVQSTATNGTSCTVNCY